MAEFFIEKTDLVGLAGKVVVVTGGSSGIGLEAVRLLLELEAFVVVGDLQPVPMTHDALAFQETNVGSWTDLQALFNKAINIHGRIDHVFANAGVAGVGVRYLEDVYDEETGALLEPSTAAIDINLKAVLNTAYLGMHHMRHQPEPKDGSIVCTSSITCIQRFRIADYAISKHGVLGFMRGVVPNIESQGLPIRVNCIAPSWTSTGMVDGNVFTEAVQSELLQPAEVPARSALLLMADESRQGQMIYSAAGKFTEIEESRLLPLANDILGRAMTDDKIVEDVTNYHVAAKGKAAEVEAEEAAEKEELKGLGGQVISGEAV